MQIETYFDFLTEVDIRIKGTRISIERGLYDYIHRAQMPEQIAERFYTMALEQVYATILYYLGSPEKVMAYFVDYLQYCQAARGEYEKNPMPVVAQLRELRIETWDSASSTTPSLS